MLHTKRISINTLVVILFLLTTLIPVFPNTQRSGRARRQGPAVKQADQRGQAEDPINRIYSATLKNGKVVKFSAAGIPANAFTTAPAERIVEQDADKEPQREKIDPALKKRIAELSGDETQT